MNAALGCRGEPTYDAPTVNYFTHAIRYLDRPYFAVGVCVPDWLSVVDRKARVRSRHLAAALPELTGENRELAEGIQKHLDDDRWFHGTAAFYRVTGQIARSFRGQLPETDSWKCGFLGHIVMELLLDACLIEQDPQRLDDYYKLMREVDSQRVQQIVSGLATKEVPQMARLIEMFVKERFLEDYLDDEKLLFRLNQVMQRIQLAPLPETILEGLSFGRAIVRSEVHQLLPAEHFPQRDVLPNAD